jgi:hypothetical protein
MIRKLVLGAAAASAVIAAAPAHATLVSYTTSGTGSYADPGIGNTGLGNFSDSGIASGTFTDTLTFTTSATGESSASITITAFTRYFSSFTATLNGTALTGSVSSGAQTFSVDIASLAAGTQTLVISGISKGGAGYGGNISAPVPEPSTWALSILGFGLIGGMLRSRRRTLTTLVPA